MANRKKIEEIKKQIRDNASKDATVVKYLRKPMEKFLHMKLSRANDEPIKIAELYYQLWSFAQNVDDTVEEISQALFEELDYGEHTLYLPEYGKKVVFMKYENAKDYVRPYSVYVENLKTDKDWIAASEQMKKK